MGKLSDEQAAQLAELEKLRDAPDAPAPADDDGDQDDGHVIVLRGSRADAFLSSLLLGSKVKPPKTTVQDDDKTGVQDDDKTGDQDDDKTGDQDDQPPPATHRFFR